MKQTKHNLPDTDCFKQYQQGIDYKNRIGYFSAVDLYWSFYNSNQWRGIKASDLPKIVLNICRTGVDYMVASIMSRKVAVQYSAEYTPDEPDGMDMDSIAKKDYASFLTAAIAEKWEKDKMDSLLRKILVDGANTGDMCLYSYWDSSIDTGQPEMGDFKTQAVDATNVIFGNPNTPLVDIQPWIEITGRATVKSLKEEARQAVKDKKSKATEEEIESISGDTETEYQIGEYGKIEMDAGSDDGKCLYIIKFWKDKGKVYWSKKTRYCPIRETVDLGIKCYPVAYGNWRTVKNSMHGMGVTRGIIDNQISINQMYAMIVYWMRKNAFGKTIYDRTRIANWSNRLDAAIPADGDVTGIVYQLQAGNFNEAIVSFANLLMQTTKDIMGISDAALGNVNPTNTSAIIAISKQSAIPLENVQANLYQLVEDWARIAGEFIMAKYETRMVTYKENGKKVVKQYTPPPEGFMASVSVNVGPSSYWSEIAGQQTLDNLLVSKTITPLQYFERIKDFNIIPDVDGIIKDLKEQAEQQKMMTEQPGMHVPGMVEQPEMPIEQPEQPEQPDYEEMAQFVETLPPEEQQRIMELPEGQKEDAILYMMGKID